MRRKKIIRTFLLVLLIAALLAGAGAAVFMIKKTFFRGPVQKYSASGEFSDSRIAGSEGKADGFAADLCVVSGDTLLDTVALEEDQEVLLLDIKNKQVFYSKGAYDRVYPCLLYTSSLCLDWLYHTEPSSDPVYFHGTDARTEKRNVDRIFLRYSDRSVFWLCYWILCADLHVCGIYQRIYLSLIHI